MADSDERIEIVAKPLPGVDVLVARRSPRLWRVFHERYSLCSGEARPARRFVDFWYRGAVHRMTNGATMLLQPGELHENRAISGPLTFRNIFIDVETLAEAAREAGYRYGAPRLLSKPSLDPAVHAAVRNAERALAASRSDALERETRFVECVQVLLERGVEQRLREPRLYRERTAMRRIRAMLIDRYEENIHLDELAAEAGLSRFHLVRSFKAFAGAPPHQFQIQVRLSVARRLLAACVPPAEVAALVGFHDQSHLTRHFRIAVGTTPAAYGRGRRLHPPDGKAEGRMKSDRPVEA